MKKSLLLSTALLALSSAPAFADNLIGDTNLETVVVTATRTPQPQNKTGDSMSIVTGDDLKTQQIDFVTDALAETPGLTVVRNGGVGQTTSIGLRGAPNGQTLFLLDGVRLEDPSATDQGAILSDLMVNNIDRIEVLRGPQSTLYGSDAIGGVVNILTKRGGADPFALVASAEGGSFGTYHLNVAANGSESIVDYGAAVNWFGTDGTSAADSRDGNTEPDGYRNLGGTANVRVHVLDNVSVDVRGYYVQSRTSYDGFPPPTYSFADDHEFSRDVLYAGYAGVNVDLFDNRFHNRFAVIGLSSDRRAFGNFDFFSGAFTPDINFYGKGGSVRLEYQGVFDIDPDNQLTVGAETQRTTLDTHSVFDLTPLNHGRSNIDGYYLQYQTTLFDALTLTGGVRLDNDAEFGTHTSYKINAAYTFAGWGTTLRGNIANGFKAPSLYEQFSDYSNPVDALKPEIAEGWEVGADQVLLGGKLRGSLTYFDRHSKDLIDFFDCFGVVSPACTARALAGGYYYNVDRAVASGVEAEIDVQLFDTLSATVNYTNLTATDPTTHLPLARRPHSSANAILNWQVTDGWSLGSSVVYVGPRFNDAFASTRLADNTTVDLFTTYKLTDQYELFGRVDNLFDNRNEPVSGYGQPGISAFAGVRATL